MFTEVIERIIEMYPGDEFCFIACEKENNEIEYPIVVKCIYEFDSLLVITGNKGGGFNMIFETSESIADRENCLRGIITEEFEIELGMCNFVRFHE